MRRFVPEICGIECGSREKSGRKVCFLLPKFLGKPSKFLWGICKSTPL